MSTSAFRPKLIFCTTAFILLLVTFQNCSDVKLSPRVEDKVLSCDPSVYDISREVQTVNGNTVYFLRQNNRDISKEYSQTITWLVNDVVQSENIIHENRLFLNCDNHAESIQVKARFVTDCGTEIEVVEDFVYPADICEEDPEEPETPNPPEYANFCEEYKASLGPIGTPKRDYFEAYNAENRKDSNGVPYEFTPIMKTFTEQTERVLGQDTRSIGPGVTPGLPGRLRDHEYLVLSFQGQPDTSYPGACDGPVGQCEEGVNTGKWGMWMQGDGAGGVKHHNITITVSPCPGDFRPPVDPNHSPHPDDPFNISLDPELFDEFTNLRCRKYGTEYYLRGSSDPSLQAQGRCLTPVGKTMYINISLRNMYTPVGEDFPQDYFCDTDPNSPSGLPYFCGVTVFLSN